MACELQLSLSEQAERFALGVPQLGDTLQGASQPPQLEAAELPTEVERQRDATMWHDLAVTAVSGFSKQDTPRARVVAGFEFQGSNTFVRLTPEASYFDITHIPVAGLRGRSRRGEQQPSGQITVSPLTREGAAAAAAARKRRTEDAIPDGAKEAKDTAVKPGKIKRK